MHTQSYARVHAPHNTMATPPPPLARAPAGGKEWMAWTERTLASQEAVVLKAHGVSVLEYVCLRSAPYPVIEHLVVELGESCACTKHARHAKRETKHTCAADIVLYDSTFRADVFALFCKRMAPREWDVNACGAGIDMRRFHRLIWCKPSVALLECVMERWKPDLRAESRGVPALHLACQSSTLAVVQVLLKHGADPNRRTTKTRGTALHALVERPRLDKEDPLPMICALLEAGADPNMADVFEDTALSLAACSGPPVAHVRVLYEYGARSTRLSRAYLDAFVNRLERVAHDRPCSDAHEIKFQCVVLLRLRGTESRLTHQQVHGQHGARAPRPGRAHHAGRMGLCDAARPPRAHL